MKKSTLKTENKQTLNDNSINIVNSNIKRSQIGHNKAKQKIIVGVFIAVLAGIILFFITYGLNWLLNH